MADLWLERELARQLAPVNAPESLWDRIGRQQSTPHRRVSLEWMFWPVVLAMLLLAFSGVLLTLTVNHDPDRLTPREMASLTRNSTGLDFRSENLEETRAWVKAESNIDIDLPFAQPAANNGAIRLLGARLLHLRGVPVAAIDYRVGDRMATLFVSGKQPGLNGNTHASKHLFSRIKSSRDEQLFSWNMRNQTYAIVFSGAKDPHGACMLCHASTPGLIVFGLP